MDHTVKLNLEMQIEGGHLQSNLELHMSKEGRDAASNMI